MALKTTPNTVTRKRSWANDTLSLPQKVAVVTIIAMLESLIVIHGFFQGFRLVLGVGFLAAAAFRFWCVATVLLTNRQVSTQTGDDNGMSETSWPNYTIILALYREAHMVPTLLKSIYALDYPKSRMEILVAAELDDPETLEACLQFGGDIPIKAAFGHGEAPQTKPRALNAALKLARGDIVVVYDAEDQPHPFQLKEAALRFAAGGERLGVVQAPLRVPLRASSTQLERQFALDYAALFEVVLPALNRVGAPFPLGGSSNHFRREALLAVGGWDPWNVTEDADIGFELARLGYRSELLSCPTYETAPRSIWPWVKQRSRWIKGHLQTLKVHTHSLSELRPMVAASLLATLSFNLVAAASTGPILLVILRYAAPSALRHHFPNILPFDVIVFIVGWSSAVLTMAVGAWKSRTRAHLTTFLLAPLFWAAQSVAFARAIHELLVRPYHWDKTDHEPGHDLQSGRVLDDDAGFGLSGEGDQPPSPDCDDAKRPFDNTMG